MKNKPELTPEQLRAAKSLRSIWDKKKKEFGLTQEIVAHEFGVSQGAVGQYLNGHTGLNQKMIFKFAKILGVNPLEISDEIIPSEFISAGTVDMTVNEALGATYNIEDAAIMTRLLPLISWVRAGEFCEAHNPLEVGDAEDWFPGPKNASDKTYALRVVGASMTSPYPNARSYPEGTIIFVDPEKEVLPGDRGIFKMADNNELTSSPA